MVVREGCPLLTQSIYQSFDGLASLVPAQDATLSEAEARSAFEQVAKQMRTMFQECKLVHADLSEFNILYWKGKCVIIDVSQSVETSAWVSMRTGPCMHT